MRAMAELGEGPYRSGDVAAKLGRRTPEVSMTRQHLIDKGLAYATEDYGHVDFTVPCFDEFMRRHMAYRAPSSAQRKHKPERDLVVR
jgi:Mn-dependent DtxR family transcriptional regulator